jgi:membrane protein required for colicin V production
MQGLPLTALDLAVAAVVGLSTLVALARGAVREVTGMLAWIGALVVAWFAFGPARPLVKEAVGNDLVTDLATVALVFLVPLLAFKILGGLLAKAVSGTGLGLADRVLGIAFGLARGVLLVTAAYLLGTMLVPKERHPDWVTRARVLPHLQSASAKLEALLPAELEGKVKAAGGGAGAEPGKGYSSEQRRQLERLLPGG